MRVLALLLHVGPFLGRFLWISTIAGEHLKDGSALCVIQPKLQFKVSLLDPGRSFCDVKRQFEKAVKPKLER